MKNTEISSRRRNLRRLAAGAIGAIALATGLVAPGNSIAAPTVEPTTQEPTTQEATTQTATTQEATPAAATAAAAATPVATSISLRAQSGGFFGYVHSASSKCESNRKVTLYKRANGTLTPVGSDIAQANGPDAMYSINTKQKGSFIAKVPATATCKAAASPVVAAQA